MRYAVLGLVIALSGCGTEAMTAPPGPRDSRLMGAWLSISGPKDVGLILNTDGTYALSHLVFEGGSTINSEQETGTYETPENAALALTPAMWTCRGANPAKAAPYAFNGSNLVVTLQDGATTFPPLAGSPGYALGSGAGITNGCFDTAGRFTAQPLAPVN